MISQSTEIAQVDQQLTAEDLGKGVVGLNYLLKQRESVKLMSQKELLSRLFSGDFQVLV